MKDKSKKISNFFKKHKKLVIILVIVAVVALIAIKAVSCTKQTQAMLDNMMNASDTTAVEKMDIQNNISATGVITSVEARTISSTVTGVEVTELNVALGDKVNAGDVLCRLDSSDLEQNIADAQKTKNAAAGQSGISVGAANRNLNNAVEVRDIDLTRADQDINAARNDYNNAQSDANDAQAKWENAQNNYNSLKQQQEELAKKKSSYEKTISEQTAIKQLADDNFRINYTYLSSMAGGLTPSMDAAVVGVLGMNNIDSYTVDNIKLETATDEQIAEATGYIDAMKTAAADSKEAAGKIDKATSGLSNIGSLDAQISAAKATAESLESAYKAAQKSADGMYAAIEQRIRNKEDITRNDNMSVASSVDNVKSANINAGTATLGDDRTIRSLEEQVEDCEIRSKINGIVTELNVIKGEKYAGGAIITIEDTSSYEITTQINEYDISKIKVGQKCTIKTNATGEEEFQGVVKEIAPRSTAKQTSGLNSVSYKVTISLLTPSDDIRLDMTAKIKIHTEEKTGVLAVPYDAVQTDEEGNTFVEVLDGDEPVSLADVMTNPEAAKDIDPEKIKNPEGQEIESHKVYVTKGIEGDYYVEIIGEGITEGIKVVFPKAQGFSDIEEYMMQMGGMGGF